MSVAGIEPAKRWRDTVGHLICAWIAVGYLVVWLKEAWPNPQPPELLGTLCSVSLLFFPNNLLALLPGLSRGYVLPLTLLGLADLAFMLALTGKMLTKDKLTRGGPDTFNQRGQHMGVGLVARTLGVVGIGNIGAELFRMAKPFDMKFIAHDPFADSKVAAELGIELVSLEDVFRRADILSVNCPLTPETHHLVNAERLALMKPTAYLINTARGPIVDQKALTAALQAGRLAGAGLDVLEQEPPEPDDPILKLDNVILSPHALCWTDQCFAGNGAADVAAVLEVQHGRTPRGVVNRAVLETPLWQQRMAAFANRFK